jgi:hypothetical protein
MNSDANPSVKFWAASNRFSARNIGSKDDLYEKWVIFITVWLKPPIFQLHEELQHGVNNHRV